MLTHFDRNATCHDNAHILDLPFYHRIDTQ